MTVQPAAARLLQAEADAAVARQRLQATLGQVQARLDPKLLADTARREVLDAGQASAEAIRRNPLPSAGIAALVGLLLARKPLWRLVRGKPEVPPSFDAEPPAIPAADPAVPQSQA